MTFLLLGLCQICYVFCYSCALDTWVVVIEFESFCGALQSCSDIFSFGHRGHKGQYVVTFQFFRGSLTGQVVDRLECCDPLLLLQGAYCLSHLFYRCTRFELVLSVSFIATPEECSQTSPSRSSIDRVFK